MSCLHLEIFSILKWFVCDLVRYSMKANGIIGQNEKKMLERKKGSGSHWLCRLHRLKNSARHPVRIKAKSDTLLLRDSLK